jgi:hypothetical protein
MKSRRGRRIARKRLRRIVATITAVGALGFGAASALPAGAEQGHSYSSCGGLNTAWNYHPGRAYSPGNAWHACD